MLRLPSAFDLYQLVYFFKYCICKIYLYYMPKYIHPEIFPSISYCCYSVVKTKSSMEFGNSIFHVFHFNNSYSTAFLKFYFQNIIHYKGTSKKNTFLVLSNLEVCFPAIQWVLNGKIFTASYGSPQERFECH